MYRDELKEKWNEAFQNYPHLRQVEAISVFLEQPIFDKVKENRHYMYLVFQMKRQLRDHKDNPSYFPQELPGMVYGMWCKAWDLLLDAMVSEEIIRK